MTSPRRGADAFDGDEAVGLVFANVLYVVDVHPRQQGAVCPVHDDAPVLIVAQFTEGGFISVMMSSEVKRSPAL